MKPEKKNLIDDLLADESGARSREAALLAGGRILRRRRWKRRAAPLGVLGLAFLLAMASWNHLSAPKAKLVDLKPVVEAAAKPLTDDELLALFPNTPVGLVTVKGKKQLVFLRAEDAQKYVGHF